MKLKKQRTWTNWSGSLSFEPRSVETPRDEAAVQALVGRAGERGETLRAVGAGHSSMPLVSGGDTLVSLEKIRGVLWADPDAGVAALGPGTVIEEAGKELHEHGLAMENMGDIDLQTIGGALGTGTHGTGPELPNLSGQLVGGRLVTGAGEVVDFPQEDGELLQAARVSLGALGIFSELRLRVLPSHRLLRREWCTHVDTCIEHLDELVQGHRNFDFYWYPRNDIVKLRTWDLPGEGPDDLPFAALEDVREGWSYQILPNPQELRFEEVEYMVPAEAGVPCFQEVRARIKRKWRREVGWRVLYRTIRADDGYLSPIHGRDSVSVSVHQNSPLPFWDLFRDMETVFRAHQGRPHWGKKHSLSAGDLRPLYPEWGRFQEVRRRLDPEGVFMNDYLRSLLEA